MDLEVEVVILTSSVIVLSLLFLGFFMIMPISAENSQVVSIPASNTTNQNHYDPQLLNIESKVSVTWNNMDNQTHTVTSIIPSYGPLAVYDSGPIPPKGNFSYTFDTPGTFEYYCTIHPSMTGKITVR